MVTLGENNSHPEAISDIVSAGADMFRLNMSHKDCKWHELTLQSARRTENKLHERCPLYFPLAIAVDLRGPEIRTGIFRGDSKNMGFAELKEGNTLRLLTNKKVKLAGTATCFWVSYPDLPKKCQIGDQILLDRGAMTLQVTAIGEDFVTCKISKGGIIRDEKIVHLIDSVVELPQVSEQDDFDIAFALNHKSDFLIVSHVRSSKMICAVRNRVEQIGSRPICILSKISSLQGVNCFDEVLKVSDGIVIDGSGIEVDTGPEKVFLAQKSIIAKCNQVGKPVVVVLHVETECSLQVSTAHVVNAVLEGADSILLATGASSAENTIDLVKKVDKACREAECARWQRQLFQELSYKASIPLDLTHSIAIAAVETSMKCNAAAILVTTTTGRSAMMVSIYRPRCPIVAITRYSAVSRLLQISFGIHPIHFSHAPLSDWNKDMDTRIQWGMNYLRNEKFIDTGDVVVIVSGWCQGSGFTNSIRVVYASPGAIPNRIEDLEVCW
ncbi:pyruvate kinase [Orussus abietinus]|uniref:pyruvate kinase n=1 Tax=Orussus abietinus TaxID=222816 RepID=UPI000C715D43|nr:pyruvate kinase [Orussus abietinus]